MAEDPWNKVNVPIPSAASSVFLQLNLPKDAHIYMLLRLNDAALGILGNNVLQTEIRVLYELLFTCKNNHGTNLTFRALKQVEQSINRLKEMKLDAALLHLGQCFANSLRRKLTCNGRFRVPSQPVLEWVSLKILGARRLLTCVMDHCSRSFIRARQQLKQNEFIVLSVVIASMVSRLWAYFKAILLCLGRLYGHVQNLLAKVSQAQPMPFLTGYPLPTDLMEFLGPPWSSQIASRNYKDSSTSNPTPSLTNMHTHDEGVPLKRGRHIFFSDEDLDIDPNPSIEIFKNVRRDPSASIFSWIREAKPEEVFRARVLSAATFKDVATHLKDMIEWCGSQKRKREKQYFSFLHLKCRRLEHLQLADNSTRGKLRRLKGEVCWVLSPSDPLPVSCRSLGALWRRTHHKTRFQPLRSRFRATGALVKAGARRQPRLVRRWESRCAQTPKQRRRTSTCNSSNVSASSGQDEIDDIFSSLDF